MKINKENKDRIKSVIIISFIFIFMISILFGFKPIEAAVVAVNSAPGVIAGSTSGTCLLPAVVAGNTIILLINGYVAISGGTPPTDNSSSPNTYTSQVSKSQTGASLSAYSYIYSTTANGNVAGHDQITVTMASSTTAFFRCIQFSGLLMPTATQTQTGGGTVNSGTGATYSTSSITPSSQDLIIASSEGVFCPGGGGNNITFPFSVIALQSGSQPGTACNGGNNIQEESTGSYTLSASNSATTSPFIYAWSTSWISNSANWAVVVADFEVATYTITTTTTTTTTVTSTISTTTTVGATITATV